MAAVLAQPLPIGPTSSLDVSWNWSGWLAAGETIAAAAVSGPAGAALFSQTQAAGIVTVWVAPQGLAAGTVLPIVCTVTTSSTPPRVDSRTISLIVQQR